MKTVNVIVCITYIEYYCIFRNERRTEVKKSNSDGDSESQYFVATLYTAKITL